MSPPRLPTVLVCLGLLVAVAAVYGQTLGHGFVDLDDADYVARNAHVLGGLSAEGVRWAFTTGHTSNWHPLTWLSLMLDVELFGSGPAALHATNAALHGAGALLLFGLLRSSTGRLWPSALAAALFAVHPLHVESVAWISERKDVLSLSLGLASIWTYAVYARRGRRAFYVATAALLALSLMAKPTLVTLPLLLLVFDLWPLGRLRLGRTGEDASGTARAAVPQRSLPALVVEKLPLALVAVASSAVTLVVQERAMSAELDFGDRLANAVVSYVSYAATAVWPADLYLLRPHPSLPGGTPLAPWKVAGAALLLAAVTLAALRARRRYLTFGWLWFVAALVPMIGLVQVGRQGMADRYAYAPLIGLYVAGAWSLDAWWSRRAERGRASRGLAAVAAAALALLGLRAWHQVRVWRDSETLFRHALAHAPRSPFLNANLANVLLASGRTAEAIDRYECALDEMPGYALVHVNLGLALQRAGRGSEAIDHFREALRADPESPEAHYNLARSLQLEGRAAEALGHYLRSIELDPDVAEAYSGAAGLLLAAGDLDGAASNLRRAVELSPENSAAHFNLGYALGALGRGDESVRHYERALALDPELTDAHVNLGQALLARGSWEGALDHYRAATRQAPRNVAALNGLARLLASHPDEGARDPERAIELAERAVELAGSALPEVHVTLAEAHAAAGDFETAARVARSILAVVEASGDAAMARGVRALLERYGERLDP